jgi:hypothetical protein
VKWYLGRMPQVLKRTRAKGSELSMSHRQSGSERSARDLRKSLSEILVPKEPLDASPRKSTNGQPLITQVAEIGRSRWAGGWSGHSLNDIHAFELAAILYCIYHLANNPSPRKRNQIPRTEPSLESKHPLRNHPLPTLHIPIAQIPPHQFKHNLSLLADLKMQLLETS